jgi:hydroxymethylglutaryl-CoA lyase
MSIDESLVELDQCIAIAGEHGVSTVIGISNALFCPYEGPVPEARLLRIIDRVARAGAADVYLGVSAGVDPPREVHDRVSAILGRRPDLRVGVHLHNTNGMALANALAAADAGACFVEGSLCGLGGGIRMPKWLSHHGNIATEDLVHMFNASGVATGIDLGKAIAAAHGTAKLLELDTVSSSAMAGGTRHALLAGEHAEPSPASPGPA